MSYYQRRNPRADLGGAARGAMAGCAPRQASWPEWAQCADTASYKRRCDAAGADGTASLPGAAHVLRQAHKFHTPALRPCSVAYARALTEAYLGLSMRRRTKKGLRDRNSPTCTLSQNGYGGDWTHCQTQGCATLLTRISLCRGPSVYVLQDVDLTSWLSGLTSCRIRC